MLMEHICRHLIYISFYGIFNVNIEKLHFITNAIWIASDVSISFRLLAWILETNLHLLQTVSSKLVGFDTKLEERALSYELLKIGSLAGGAEQELQQSSE